MFPNKMINNKIVQEDLNLICKENLEWQNFSGKNILITGANGMLPSYMIETFLLLMRLNKAENIHVFALARNGDRAKKRFDNYLKDEFLNIIVQDVCEPICIDEKIDIIIHAASQASPKYYRIDPVGTLTPNIIGTINLLNLAREKNVENFLFFSSSEVYGTLKTDRGIKESDFGYLDPLNVLSCYSESKRMGETICISWHEQFNIPVKVVRPFHTYGPGLKLEDGRVFADFVKNILSNQPLEIKSDGTAHRAFCYLSDAVLGFFYTLLKGNYGEVYNVGNPFQEYSVKELAEILIEMFPEKSLDIEIQQAFSSPDYIAAEVSRVVPDITKLQSLGWSPKVDVKTGFYRTILSFL